MLVGITHQRRVGRKDVDHTKKFLPLGRLCEERDDTDYVTPCDYFNRTTRKCEIHNVNLGMVDDISHGLRPRLLHKKTPECLSQTMDFSETIGMLDESEIAL
jgi:hypothetical protein